MSKQALLLLGGTWHPFERFHEWIEPLLRECGYETRATYDLDDLLALKMGEPQLVVQYTSFGVHERFPDATPSMGSDQTKALASWLAQGGRLLGVHSATVVGALDNPVQERLYGARFIEHPPQFTFTVWPTAREHPILNEIEAFAVHDEFYMQTYGEDMLVHMSAIDRGRAYPMVWTREPGDGRLAYIGMGHSERVWTQPAYRRLMHNAIQWLQS